MTSTNFTQNKFQSVMVILHMNVKLLRICFRKLKMFTIQKKESCCENYQKLRVKSGVFTQQEAVQHSDFKLEPGSKSPVSESSIHHFLTV